VIDPGPSHHEIRIKEQIAPEADVPWSPSYRERAELKDPRDTKAKWNGDDFSSDGSQPGRNNLAQNEKGKASPGTINLFRGMKYHRVNHEFSLLGRSLDRMLAAVCNVSQEVLDCVLDFCPLLIPGWTAKASFCL
jgi:hypothetical protein